VAIITAEEAAVAVEANLMLRLKLAREILNKQSFEKDGDRLVLKTI
jgi:hypothetical protein